MRDEAHSQSKGCCVITQNQRFSTAQQKEEEKETQSHRKETSCRRTSNRRRRRSKRQRKLASAKNGSHNTRSRSMRRAKQNQHRRTRWRWRRSSAAAPRVAPRRHRAATTLENKPQNERWCLMPHEHSRSIVSRRSAAWRKSCVCACQRCARSQKQKAKTTRTSCVAASERARSSISARTPRSSEINSACSRSTSAGRSA